MQDLDNCEYTCVVGAGLWADFFSSTNHIFVHSENYMIPFLGTGFMRAILRRGSYQSETFRQKGTRYPIEGFKRTRKGDHKSQKLPVIKVRSRFSFIVESNL